jgi:hypothetical protein
MKNKMKNKIVLFSMIGFYTLISNYNFSQDIITKKTGDDILSKILEVGQLEVKYKKFDNLSGPVFTIQKTELIMIRYENGTKDIFSEMNSSKGIIGNSNIDMLTKGKEDAKMNYKGRRSGAGWTTATTIILSPIIGVIPAIACSIAEPNEDNLNYKDSELMKNNIYNESYKKESHKIKKRKIWKNFGIGSTIWGILYLFTIS